MGLSSDLISQFVKVTNDKTETKKETITYGTIVEDNGTKYVQLDGSTIRTPLTSVHSAADVNAGDRVTVMIKNHTATITGNLSNPSATSYIISAETGDTEKLVDAIQKFGGVLAGKVSTEELEAETARIDTLVAENVTIKDSLTARKAEIETLIAENATITEKLTANEADISDLEVKKLDAEIADATYATIENLDATNADIHNLEATYGEFVDLTTERFDATDATINSLNAKYVNIDFSNIDKAWMEEFYAKSGIVEYITAEDGTYTGRLVGVTISGDVIEGNTIVAEKLVVKGEDGLYYKLNTDGETVESEQTDYNSLNGQVIKAKSVTAEKISVSDLVAFDATIGGFNITDNAIFSEVKDSEGNTTRGIYMDTDGQMNFGDETNFIKYYRDEDGTYKLAISAASILYALNGKQYSIADLGRVGEYVHIGTYPSDNLTLFASAEDGHDYFYLADTNIGQRFVIEGADRAIWVTLAVRATDGRWLYTPNTPLDESLFATGDQSSNTFTMLGVDLIDDGYNDPSAQFVYEVNGVRSSTTAYFDYRLPGYGYTNPPTLDPLTCTLDEAEISARAVYVYEDEPCIELGETDSDFKLVITNTRIMFKEGSSVPAYITNQSLHITKAVIEEEIQQGEFVWRVRQNGNMGLMWKGDT